MKLVCFSDVHGYDFDLPDGDVLIFACDFGGFGSEDEAIKFKYHIFGHIHQGYGKKVVGKKTYLNVSLVNDLYYMVNKPVVIEL